MSEQRHVTVYIEGRPLEVSGYPDEEGADDQQILINSETVEEILTEWMESTQEEPNDSDRNYIKTTGRDYVMAATFTDGLTLSLTEWPEAGDYTYYLNDGPITWSADEED